MLIDTLVQKIGLFTNEAIMIADVDPDNGSRMLIRWINPAFTRLLQYRLDDIAGKTARCLTGPRTDPDILAGIIDRLAEWQSFTCELVLHCKDGAPLWVQMSFQPTRGDDGQFRYWICLIQDISIRKEAESRLTDMSLIAQTTHDLAAVLDNRLRISWINSAFTRFSGYTIDEVRGQTLLDALGAVSCATGALDEVTARLRQEATVDAEIVARRRDGRRFLGRFEFQPVFDADGQLSKYLSLVRDITDEHSAALRYQSVFEQTNAAISLKSAGRYEMVNRTYAAQFGRTPEDLIGRVQSEVLPESSNALQINIEASVLATGRPAEYQAQFKGRDGKRHLLVRTFRIRDPVLGQDLVCSVGTDISGIREAEAKLRESRAQARAAEQRLWSAIDAVPDGFVLYDRNDCIVLANKAFKDQHAPLIDEIEAGVTFGQMMSAGYRKGVWDDPDGLGHDTWLRMSVEQRDSAMREGVFCQLADGRWLLCKEVELGNGERAGLRSDVTEVKGNEQALKEARRAAERAHSRMMTAIRAISDNISIYDPQDRLVATNRTHHGGDHWPEFEHGITFEELLRRSLKHGKVLDAVGREDQWLVDRMKHHRNPGPPLEQRLSDGGIYRVIERKTPEGDTVNLRLDITELRMQELRLGAYARDLEMSKKAVEDRNRALEMMHAELEHASLHDALTGLPNRRALEQRLRALSAGYETGSRVAAMHIDLDRFKEINDAFGHAAGDHVLCHVARVLREMTRSEDFAARVGGDEFVVLCDAGPSPALLDRFAGRVIDALSQPVRFEGQECRFGASVGVAVAETAAQQEKLLINADIALYRAKSSGRNRWAIFTERMENELLRTKALSDELLRAVDRHEFSVVYQPQFDAATLNVVGVEALLRWHHPDRGVLSPSDFISTAEDLGIVGTIDRMVMQQTMANDAAWQSRGLKIPRIAINVSGRRLRDASLLTDIKQGSIAPERLSIEILESVFVDAEDQVLTWNIDQLREMGVEIELDDFGTGHSSVVGLIKLKPTRLKVDRHFIDQALGTDQESALIRAIVDLGRSLGVMTVAEGVETRAQGALLARMGCDVLQGFAYARPMSPAELPVFLRAQTLQKGRRETS